MKNIKEIANKIVEFERMESEYANVILNYEIVKEKYKLSDEEMEKLIDAFWDNEHVADCYLEEHGLYGVEINITFWTDSCPEYTYKEY